MKLYSCNIKISKALSVLDKIDEKCLIIVDKKNCFYGTLTDGDIRRGFLKNLKTSSTIKDCVHRNSKFFYKNKYSILALKKIFKLGEIKAIPILTKSNKVYKIIYNNTLTKHKEKNKNNNIPVVIIAGGQGKRLQPFTSVLPKPLIPINGKPTIEQIILNFEFYGFKKFIVSLNHKSKIIKYYFNDKKYNIKYLDENKPTGTAGSLKRLYNRKESLFIISNCDILSQFNFNNLIEFHNNNNNNFTTVTSDKKYEIQYATINSDKSGLVNKISEKPVYNFTINVGIYLIDKKCIKLMPNKEPYDMNQFIELLIKKNLRVGAYPISENDWSDVGKWEEYKDSISKLSIKN